MSTINDSTHLLYCRSFRTTSAKTCFRRRTTTFTAFSVVWPPHRIDFTMHTKNDATTVETTHPYEARASRSRILNLGTEKAFTNEHIEIPQFCSLFHVTCFLPYWVVLLLEETLHYVLDWIVVSFFLTFFFALLLSYLRDLCSDATGDAISTCYPSRDSRQPLQTARPYTAPAPSPPSWDSNDIASTASLESIAQIC